MMKIKIDDIIIDERIRKNMGDIELLAESMKKNGLLNPPIISSDNHLIAGERRIRAAKLLGWEEIPVRKTQKPINKYRAVEVEIAENVDRKDFSRSERVYCGMVLEEHEKVESEKRMKAGKPSDPGDNSPQGKTRDIVARRLGISGTTYDHEKFIVDHRKELSEEEFAAWDRGEVSTNKIYNKLKPKKIEQCEAVGKQIESAPSHRTIREIDEEIDRTKRNMGDLSSSLDRLYDERWQKFCENDAKIDYTLYKSTILFVVYCVKIFIKSENGEELVLYNGLLDRQEPGKWDMEKCPEHLRNDFIGVWRRAKAEVDDLTKKIEEEARKKVEDDMGRGAEQHSEGVDLLREIPQEIWKKFCLVLAKVYHPDNQNLALTFNVDDSNKMMAYVNRLKEVVG